jgi:hypothetical protein
MQLSARIIKAGQSQGMALVSPEPIGFLGGVDPASGQVIEPQHPLYGQTIAGRMLVFPTAKGSTVGSYVLYRLKKAGRAPAGIINAHSEPIVAVGAIIADIPMVDHVDLAHIKTGDWVIIDGQTVTIHPLEANHDS